jgi:hypothetical protein
MKTNTLIIATLMLLSSCIVKATVITVSNNPVSGGQYNDVQTAINASAAGDTIYVMGSPIQYDNGGINVTKRLVLIGAGYNVNNTTNNNLITQIGSINLDSIAFNSQVSGSQIIGFYVNGSIGVTNGYLINDILIERCYVSSAIYTNCSQGWVIQNNIVNSSIDFYGNTDIITSCIVRNNFLIGGLYSNGQITGSGLLVDHNIFEAQISTINYATVTNNVFFFAHISASPNNQYNVYTNNITVYSTADDLPFGDNSGTGDQNNVNPNQVYGSGLTGTVGYPALLSDDWQLVSGSPGIKAATDGTDIGIYGGSAPMPNFTGASTLPQMTELNIKNSAIPVNGTLNYEFKARVQN